jgi:bifunctional non-homologous end joining protein LigD
MRSATLHYREGSRDKVYQAAIEPRNNLFVVTFAYGRRGTTLQTGIKTQTPVDLPTAEQVFDKLVREKTAKGYKQIDSGTPYQQPDQPNTSTGIRPQLLNAIDEAEASKLMSDANWCLQEKKDGKRLLIKKDSGKIIGINRRGLPCSLPVPVVQELVDFECDFILDGEIVDDTYFIFDLLLYGERTWMLRPYQERLNAMRALFSDMRDHVLLIETIHDQFDKMERLRELQKVRAEGVVFKLLSAPYAPGRPNTGGPALKYKFTTTGSFIVAGINKSRSVSLKLWQQDRTIGNVTIPPNHLVPRKGAVVEVRYLYAFRGGSLFQPVYLGQRDDIDEYHCVGSQLKFKQEGEENDQ